MKRAPIFQTLRTIIGRGLRQSEVDQFVNALDCADGNQDACAVLHTGSDPDRRIGPAGIAMIKRFEGCARVRSDGMIEAYPDPGTGGAPWTIGWGATGQGLDAPIGPGTVWTQHQCDERLERDLVRYASDVTRALNGAPTTQSQFDALVSFHYNTGAIARATLTRRHKAGDYAAAQSEFSRWNRAGGRVMRGLSRRRAAEAQLYAGG